MNKRVLCILLAAALLCVPALASGTHEVSVTFDSAMGSVELQTSSGAAGDNIYFYVKPALMYEPANPAISTAAGLAVQCYAAGVEGLRLLFLHAGRRGHDKRDLHPRGGSV